LTFSTQTLEDSSMSERIDFNDENSNTSANPSF